MMTYTKERVLELARMSRISMTEADAESYAQQLSAMRALADCLQNNDAGEEDLFLDAIPLAALREDAPLPCLSLEEILRMSPKATEDGIVVPRVVEG